MGWEIESDSRHKNQDGDDRDIGHGVPATCDHPGCGAAIHRGLYHVCGGEPYGGEHGCGLFFCSDHLFFSLDSPGAATTQLCERCSKGEPEFEPTPDVEEWTHHKETDGSWAAWRAEKA